MMMMMIIITIIIIIIELLFLFIVVNETKTNTIDSSDSNSFSSKISLFTLMKSEYYLMINTQDNENVFMVNSFSSLLIKGKLNSFDLEKLKGREESLHSVNLTTV